MDKSKIASLADQFREEAKNIPDPSMSNYKEVLSQYKRLLNDILVLIRELAQQRESQSLDSMGGSLDG